MTVSEFKSWQEFYFEEPFGDVRADLRIGVLSALVARAAGGAKARDVKPLDFMPVVKAQHDADERERMATPDGFWHAWDRQMRAAGARGSKQ
jgi:hypothetical protein